MNREVVGLGSHSPSRSSPVPDKPYGFCGRKAPLKKKVSELRSCVTGRRGWAVIPHPICPSVRNKQNREVSVDENEKRNESTAVFFFFFLGGGRGCVTVKVITGVLKIYILIIMLKQ